MFTDPVPRETLLHFAARRGFELLCEYLLTLPGSSQALELGNRYGHLPIDVACAAENGRIVEILLG